MKLLWRSGRRRGKADGKEKEKDIRESSFIHLSNPQILDFYRADLFHKNQIPMQKILTPAFFHAIYYIPAVLALFLFHAF